MGTPGSMIHADGLIKEQSLPPQCEKGWHNHRKKTLFGSINLSTLRVMKVFEGAKSCAMSKVVGEAREGASGSH